MYGKESWGRYPAVKQRVVPITWRNETDFSTLSGTLLPYGYGRSYGDACLNDGGTVIATRTMNHVINFDRSAGYIRAEAGISLQEILALIVPHGWFIPVSPGTQFVTLGGAIANDIHGKNHHVAGTFGRHVRRMLVQRFDGEQIECSPGENSDFFNASLGGLGLTGLILWAEFSLIPIANRYMATENIRFDNLNEFFEISESSDTSFEYTVAWLDCVSSGNSFGRGIFMRGNHATEGAQGGGGFSLPVNPIVPFDLPAWSLNSVSVKAFNTLYYHKQFQKISRNIVDYVPFFYPLDAVLHWNRIYGAAGFMQFQCVVGRHGGKEALTSILKKTVASGEASFLAVLKEFGEVDSPGLLSFPQPGYTLCLDFPNRGEKTLRLLRSLEELVVASGGALYPAKDACMAPATFRQCFPRQQEFREFLDPRASSSFWRRVTSEDKK